MKRVRLLAAVGTLSGLVAMGTSSVSATTSTPSTPSVAVAGSGRIVPLDGGWQVTLQLAQPLAVRDSAPILAVDGHPVGAARESADHRTLTVVTTDPAVAPTGTVTLWSPQSAGTQRPNAPRSGTSPGGPALPTPTLGTDPGATGPYGVAQREYDLGDQAIALPGIGGQRAELRGHVYAPVGASGSRPLVIFLHGRHEFCYGPVEIDFNQPWPCPSGDLPIPSYRGYDAPARALASHGNIVVSISADAINAWDWLALDGGALARAQLVLAHLDLWQQWSTVGGGPFGSDFVGRVNMNNIGLMGHSRGGEGVVRAALLNLARPHPYGVRALVALAPTDFARPTIPGVATSVILPYCDGDVIDLQGQHFYDDTRYSFSTDNVLRSTALVMGANHNFFNSEWTPGLSAAPSFDDWFGDPVEAPCGTSSGPRLAPLEQQAAGRAYIAGFLEMVLDRNPALLPMFDGSGARVASAGRAVVDTVAQLPLSARRDLARLDAPSSAVTNSGAATTQVCAGVPSFFSPPAGGLPLCSDTFDSAQTPHWTAAYLAPDDPTTAVTRLRWSGPSGRLLVSLASDKRDLRGFQALTARMAPDPAVLDPVDVTLRLVDGAGHTGDVPVSTVSNALTPLPGIGFGLPKTMLREVRVPLSSFKNVNLADIRTVAIVTNRVPSGSIFVSDLALARGSSYGQSAPIDAPRLSIADVQTVEGGPGPHTLRFHITMSRASTRTVRVFVDAGSFNFGPSSVARRLVLLPGQTSANVAITYQGNTRDGPDLQVPVVLATPSEAIVDHSIATGTVFDDDPSPTVTITNGSGVEGDGTFVHFALHLSAPSDNFVDVFAQLKSGSAVLGQDIGSDDIVFGYVPPGDTVGSLDVPIIDDHVHEGTETFTATLLGAFGAQVVGTPTATGTIFDND